MSEALQPSSAVIYSSIFGVMRSGPQIQVIKFVIYSRRRYIVSVSYRSVPFTPYRTFKKSLARPYRFIVLGVTQYYCYTRSECRAESSYMLIFLVCLPLLFFPPVSYSAVPLLSIDYFCSSHRFIASLLARFALIHRSNRSCSYSRQFRLVHALLLARSASVRQLFLLFSSINSFSSCQFRSSLSIVSALLVARSASVRRLFCSSSHPFRSSPSIVYTLLVY